MPKIGKAAGATIDGVQQGEDNPVIFRGKTMRITDGAIEFASAPGQNYDLRITRDSNGALGGAVQLVEHDFATHGWQGFRPATITADSGQTFTPSTSTGRGIVSAASSSAANHRVAYLRDGTSWRNSEITSTIYGPTADWNGTNAQQGHLHRVKETSTGVYEGIAVWTSIVGGSDYGYLHANAVTWNGTTLNQATNADAFFGPFGYGDSSYIDHRLQVIGVQRSQPLLWANDYRVARPARISVAATDLVDLAGFTDTTFNATAIAVNSITDAAAGVVRVVDSVNTSAVAYTATKLGYITPSGVDAQKRWCPFKLATRVVEGTASSVTIEAKRWHVDEPEPDWGDSRVQRASPTVDSDVTAFAQGPGLCGLWAAHFNTSSGGSWGPVRFKQVAL